MEQNLPQEKWQATFRAELERAEADQIWPLFQDFFGVDKWFPVAVCDGIHGTNGEPGCIRYCSGFGFGPPEENGSADVNWTKERLIVMDNAQKTFTYDIADCNIGFNSYIATVRVVPRGGGGGGCAVEWSISVDPVEGMKFEDLALIYQPGLEHMLKKMELAVFS